MIYVEAEPCHSEGQQEFFRVYADSTQELKDLAATMRLAVVFLEPGQPNEHILMQDHFVRQIKGAVTVDERAKVKLFMTKGRTPVVHASDCAVHNAPAYAPGECDCQGQEGIEDVHTPPDPESIDAFMEANPLPLDTPVDVVPGLNPDRWGPNGEDLFSEGTEQVAELGEDPPAFKTGRLGGRGRGQTRNAPAAPAGSPVDGDDE
jgi:hypothetical protein